jgi:hypothetical protein
MPDLELLSLFKALADATRLRLVGLLADHEYTVEQLAAFLDLTAPTISHHLARLSEAGLVSARADGYYSVFRLEAQPLETLAALLNEPTALTRLAEGIDRGAYDQRVLGNFLREDGSLKEIPAQRKKRSVILRHILDSFQIDKRYPEGQINEILARFHPDTAMLRRELVGLGWLAREGSVYWRVKLGGPTRDQSSTWSVW